MDVDELAADVGHAGDPADGAGAVVRDAVTTAGANPTTKAVRIDSD
jgi:hypothetical protein